MLKREVELRKCPATLARMAEVEAKKGDWVMVAENVQKQVLAEFAQIHPNHFRPSLQELRLAALRHPEIAFWVKYNRARRGHLRAGVDVGPNVNLLKASNGQPTKLLEGCGENDRTIVVAGSFS